MYREGGNKLYEVTYTPADKYFQSVTVYYVGKSVDQTRKFVEETYGPVTAIKSLRAVNLIRS